MGNRHPLEVYRPNVPRSGQSERSQDEFLPDYLRPPKDILDEEPHFLAEKPLPKPNYLGNPDSIYRLLPRKSGSDGRSETSTAGSCSPSHHHNGCSKKMCPCEGVKAKCRSTVSEEFCRDHLGPTYATEYVGYSATSDWPSEALLTNEEKCVITLSQIFGWRKAIRVVRNNPRVRVVSRLVDFALVEPDEADDDKPGEDILNYAELVDLLKAAKAPSSDVPNVGEHEENLIDLSEDLISATNATAPDDTVADSLSESLSILNLDLASC
ncbi:hypothetical protein KIN20_023598 [Parelaphostrongylus tenuis]|uniref:Uncharacterized protein n=1 Tax=Parelaphostrongylus tenuis TaxID=148309 RepID=A0AAD5MVU8_PARTN|nr:hypothetical protein KIN20_023598 [Parelaphostrongylus tenuis]